MFKKAIAGVLSFAMIMTLNIPFTAETISAAETATEDEIWAKGEELELEEEIYVNEESIEGNFIAEGELVVDDFSDGEAAFSDEAVFFTAGEQNPEASSLEKILEVTEGEDITGKLNSALLEMKDKATDTQMCKVIVPPGNYVITGQICTYSNIHLIANGAVIKKVSPERHLLLRLGNTPESAGGYEGYRNVIIEGGTWDGNYESLQDKENAGGSVGFRIGHATNVEIKNVTFINNFKSHFLELGGVKDAKITGCTFRGYWEPYEKGGQEAIQIDACKDYIMPDYFPYDGAVCENIHIEGNAFESVFSGVGSHSMVFDKPYRNIVIVGNTFRNLSKRAVWCLNYVDSVVKNNVMINVGAGVYVSLIHKKNTHLPEGEKVTNKDNQYKANILVSDNRIHLNEAKVIDGNMWRGSGVSILGEKTVAEPNGIPDGEYLMDGVAVRRNKITGLGNGVRMILAKNCSITDNVIELSSSGEFDNCGISLGNGSANLIAGNQVRGSKGNGIYLYRTPKEYSSLTNDNVLIKNIVFDCIDDGIVIGRGSYKTIAERNIVKNVGADGIVVYGNKNNSVIRNTIGGCRKNGVFLSSAKSAEVYGNTITGCTLDGIHSEGRNTGHVLKKNSLSKNSGSGMHLTGTSGMTVAGNKVVSNEINGIGIVKCSGAIISGNDIQKNKGYAVFGEDSSIKTYSKNKLSGNGHKNTIYTVNTSLPYN